MRGLWTWLLWKIAGRTPMLWEDFGRGVRRRGYYLLDSNRKRESFVEAGTDQIYI